MPRFPTLILCYCLLLVPGLTAWAEEDNGDPWEGFNRKVFSFNEFVDRYALKPVARGYKFLMPGWADDSVTRVFANLADVRSGLNNLLQWEWHEAGHNFGRFGVNTTLGVAGLFDVATDLRLRKYPDDLDLTLAKWGVSPGPYLVLPFWGSSTVRGAAVIWPEDYMRPRHYIEHDLTRHSVTAVYVVDLRADLLEVEKAVSGDRYIFLRDLYLQSRRLAAGEDIEDDFGAGMSTDDGWGDSPSGEGW